MVLGGVLLSIGSVWLLVHFLLPLLIEKYAGGAVGATLTYDSSVLLSEGEFETLADLMMDSRLHGNDDV